MINKSSSSFHDVKNLTFLTINDKIIPIVPTKLEMSDILGHWKSRWGIGRMKYKIKPGLYAVGNPNPESPVFASANYKMSFDILRRNLVEIDAWILVLDTKGINVWCAAGKGTFGTNELVNRIKETQLEQIIHHKRIIVPQLGAVGVSAPQVKKHSGFKVIYGPIRAKDISNFLLAKLKATPDMRIMHFTLWDRTVLIPIELMMWGKYILATAVCLFLMAGFYKQGVSVSLMLNNGLPYVILLIFIFLLAGILGPLLLPWLPGRSFSVKGTWLGILLATGIMSYWWNTPSLGLFENYLSLTAWILLIPSISSFILMNFTGATTFTSLSGVKKEMRIAVPFQIVSSIVGLGLWLTGRFI